MPFWKSKSKFPGRVFAILCIRPTADKDETGGLKPTNGLAGHVLSDLPPRSRPLPIPTTGLTYTDPTIVQGPGPVTTMQIPTKGMKTFVFSIKCRPQISHSVSILSGAREVSLTGGNFYAVEGNLTIQRTGKQMIVFYDRNRANEYLQNPTKLWRWLGELYVFCINSQPQNLLKP